MAPPPRPPQTTTPQLNIHIAQLNGAQYAATTMAVGSDSFLPIDPTASDLEPPPTALFEHLLDAARDGGFVYLTRHRQRVAAVVPADVAESLQREEADTELDDLLEEAHRTQAHRTQAHRTQAHRAQAHRAQGEAELGR